MFGIGPEVDWTKAYDEAFGASDEIYQVLSVCLLEVCDMFQHFCSSMIQRCRWKWSPTVSLSQHSQLKHSLNSFFPFKINSLFSEIRFRSAKSEKCYQSVRIGRIHLPMHLQL